MKINTFMTRPADNKRYTSYALHDIAHYGSHTDNI
jgi:hypothetical protein